jgi:DNA-binding CsgD family transcriptional regulator
VSLTNEDSTALKNHDLRELFEIVYAVNQGVGLADIRPRITTVLKQVFRAGAVCFFLGDKESGEIDHENVIGSGLNMAFLDPWVKTYHRIDPFLFAPALRATVCKVDDIMPYEEWAKLEIYKNFYSPQNIHHKLSIFLRSDGKTLGLIGILRPRECPDFSQVELEKARVLAPHLAAALENWRYFSEVQLGRKQPYSQSNRVPLFSIMVLDYNLQPVCWNHEAYELCLSVMGKTFSPLFQDREGQNLPIHPEFLSDCSHLRTLFDRNGKVTTPRCERIVEMGQNRTFRVISSLVEHPFSENPTPGFVVGVMDLSGIDSECEDRLIDKYNLTTRELEITRNVCRGLTNYEIGQKLYISRFTVEAHLRNIFSKTGVKHRAGLADILGSLSADTRYTSALCDTL